MRPEIKLKNFKIEKDLIEDYELLCRLKLTDFTNAVTEFIKSEVDRNRKLIDTNK